MEELLALPEPPDAVVAANNLLGVGVIQVLTEHDLTPPKVGVAVVGSLPFTTLTPNAVTVVRLPARHMGVTAAKMLLERIAGDDQPARARTAGRCCAARCSPREARRPRLTSASVSRVRGVELVAWAPWRACVPRSRAPRTGWSVSSWP